MVYYLKVNRLCDYTYRNLQHWIDIIACDKTDKVAYIICDKADLQKEIIARVSFKSVRVNFITSTRNNDAVSIAKNSCEKFWWMAACAHMTTFFHAKANNYDEFWNIDADDTCICLSPERAALALVTARNYAKDNEIKLFSLDMWLSYAREFENSGLWSFGVTYTDNSVDWISHMKKYQKDEGVNEAFRVHNLDIYFYYLSLTKIEKIESFYFENLKFIHYSDDFIAKPFSSGLSHWSNGELIYPIIYYAIGNQYRGKAKIASEVVKLDIQIKDNEALEFLTEYAPEALPMF